MTPRQLASTVLRSLFGDEHFQHNGVRLLQEFAVVVGDPRIAAQDDIFSRFNSMFGGTQ